MLLSHEETRFPRVARLDHRDRTANRELTQSDALEPIRQAYSRQGGLLSGEEVSLLMRRHCDQPMSQLARWIVDLNIVSLDSQGQIWIPLFQFDQADMTIKPAVAAVLAELSPLLDGHELAVWFASANEWLSGASPLDAVALDSPAVLKAARADRFVIRG